MQLSISLGYCAGPPIGGVLKEVRNNVELQLSTLAIGTPA